jgi:protein-S-isoprenylcysteine O-methyltransferase Ste14
MTIATRFAPLELRVPPLVVVLIIGLANWLAARAAAQWVLRFPGQSAVAALAVVAGVMIMLAGVLAFRRAHTTVDPVHADRASTLVATGIYRVTRNPMYLGMLLVLAGWSIYLGHAAGLVLLPAFVLYMNRFQIMPEERVLAAKFGDAFAAYRRSVRRWV